MSQQQVLRAFDGNKVELVRLGDIKIPSYQRDQKRTSNLVRDHYNTNLMEVLTLSRRPDGTLWLVDGKQRVTGLREKYRREGDETSGSDLLLLARVIDGLSIPEEIVLFVSLNRNRVRISAYAEFVAMLEGEEPSAIALKRAISGDHEARSNIEAYEVGISERYGTRRVGGVDGLSRIMAWDDHADRYICEAVDTILYAYGSQKEAFHSAILQGLCIVLEEIHRNQYSDSRWAGARDFAEEIAHTYPTPDELLAACKGYANFVRGGGHGMPFLAAALFAKAWNMHHKGRNKVEIFRTTLAGGYPSEAGR